MSLNLTPQYHAADAKYRAAHSPEEKLAALEEMWRELPKHKSSEKMQGELKRKLSAARKALQVGEHKGATRVDPFHVPKSGAGQIVLVGAPNVGKSSIVGGLTSAHVKIADYPFSTVLPLPGMVPFEDIKIQLVDTPPMTADHVPAGMPGLWRSADALFVVVDLASDALLEDAEHCMRRLAERGLAPSDTPGALTDDVDAAARVPGLVLANKIDLPGAADNLELLRELLGGSAKIETLSAREPQGMRHLPQVLFRLLRVVRIYAKPPGKKPDHGDPFVLPEGSDVHEMARKVHRGMERRIKSARCWGHGVADGQQVHLTHVLHDKDVIELHE